MATERIRILANNVRYVGRPLVRGGEYELPTWYTQGLVRARLARVVVDPEPVTVLSPEESLAVVDDVGELPADLPGRAHLVAAGYSTIDAVRGIRDVITVPGIGPATSRRIVAYLTQQTEGESDG